MLRAHTHTCVHTNVSPPTPHGNAPPFLCKVTGLSGYLRYLCFCPGGDGESKSLPLSAPQQVVSEQGRGCGDPGPLGSSLAACRLRQSFPPPLFSVNACVSP